MTKPHTGTTPVRCDNKNCQLDITFKIQVYTKDGETLCENCNHRKGEK